MRLGTAADSSAGPGQGGLKNNVLCEGEAYARKCRVCPEQFWGRQVGSRAFALLTLRDTDKFHSLGGVDLIYVTFLK
jgi:hypothetical protein